jgi:hypothetical protein
MCVIVATAALAPSASMAQPARSGSATFTLSDAEKAELLSHNTEASVDAARMGVADPAAAGRHVHGEVGAMIGSNGARGAYGTAAIPLGENGGAIVSFESSRIGRRR